MTRFGGPEALVPGEAPDPVAGPGQVVIDVSVAGVTFVETQIRRGVDKWHDKPALPYVPGGTVAGRVSSLGEGVDPSWSGQRVIADLGMTGGLAERAVAVAEDLIPVPEGLELPEATALHTDGSTAFGLAEGAGILPGEWVLVEAAAGGVGTLLVQLARATGAKVVGAARGTRKLDLIRDLGADAVVDYSTPDWAERVREVTDGVGPNLVFDGVGGEIGRTAFDVTANGGRFSIHGASSGEVTAIDPTQARQRGIRVIGVEQLFDFGPKMREWAQQAMSATVSGQIRPVIGQTFPMERAADAHAVIESRGALGKTLLLI
ncbi:zinc-binding dehydrogenase [Streptosporangium saharense]|uniref:zinc-binding dehydrogenase n=1 Tax=Streptosporangium saharense TaxID=1706840 RepID=UPI00367F9B4F